MLRALFRRLYSTHPSPANHSQRKKTTVDTIKKLYKNQVPITMMTAHDYPSGHFTDVAGMDMTLIGDSLAMVALGYDSTLQITLDEMMHHSRAVARGAKTPFLVGDMPFGSYESDSELAVRNSVRYLKEGSVEAVKLEGGEEMASTIHRITSVGIPVLGHIGLTPQRVASLGGFKAQGRTVQRAKQLLKDATALEQAGCFAIVLEAIPEPVADLITKSVNIPTIGIGSGPVCSGQVLVQLDILGVYDKLAPKFSKIYSNVGKYSIEALKQYGEEVRQRAFPVSGTHTYKMLPGEEEAFKLWMLDQESKLRSGI
jgi:3-methyl-2-oxobutanoate hydroxymethyltransferase